jgi:hypothetical protein
MDDRLGVGPLVLRLLRFAAAIHGVTYTHAQCCASLNAKILNEYCSARVSQWLRLIRPDRQSSLGPHRRVAWQFSCASSPAISLHGCMDVWMHGCRCMHAAL